MTICATAFPFTTKTERRFAIFTRHAARNPWFFPISQVYQILRAGSVLPLEEHTTLLRAYMTEAPPGDGRF